MLNWTEKELNFDDIIVDSELQLRVKLSEERISEFVEIFEELPAIKIIKDGSENFLADGFHRLFAAKRLRKETLKVNLAEGKYRDALEIAVKENGKTALPLSRQDKRRAIEKMLMFFPERANSWIAEDIGTSMQTVDSVRGELESDGKLSHRDTFERRDGRTTPREYNIVNSDSEEKVEEKDEDDDILDFLTSGQSVVDKDEEKVEEKDEEEELIFKDLSIAKKQEVVEENFASEEIVVEDEKDEVLLELDLPIVEPINLPTNLYKLVFSKQNGKLDIRLYFGYGENKSPTDIGVNYEYDGFVRKIKEAL